MKSTILTSIAFFTALLCASSSFAQSLQYQIGTFEDMTKNAEKTRQPFIILFETKDCRECEQLKNTTLQNEGLTRFLGENFTVYKVDAFSAEGTGTAQMFDDITDYPTVMIFGISGIRSRIVSNIYEVSSFEKQARFALNDMSQPARPANVSPDLFHANLTAEEYAIVQRQRNGKAESKKLNEAEMSEEKWAAETLRLSEEEQEFDKNEADAIAVSQLGDVPGLQKNSVKERKPKGYAVKIGQFTTLEGLKAEAASYEKKWKNQVWVYTQERQGTKQYCLALGLYEDKESALYIRRLLYQNFSLSGAVILLDEIRY